MGSPRPGVVDVQRGSHEVTPCSMEKRPLLHRPGNASSTGQCPQVTHVKTSQKHDTTGVMLYTEKNGPRENIQSMDRVTPMEILVKDNGKEVDTLETIAVRCGNGWYIKF